MQKINVIITGVTGMIGEGLLYQCLNHDNIEKVLVITRKSSGYKHPKLTEIIQRNLSDISSLKDSLLDYNPRSRRFAIRSVR